MILWKEGTVQFSLKESIKTKLFILWKAGTVQSTVNAIKKLTQGSSKDSEDWNFINQIMIYMQTSIHPDLEKGILWFTMDVWKHSIKDRL